MNDAREMLYYLIRSLSYKEGEFKLKSGKPSPYYVDCKQTSLTQEGMKFIGKVFYQKIKELNTFPCIVAGVSLGGDPLVCATVLEAFNKEKTVYPCLVRKETKTHGTGKRVEISREVEKELPLYLLEDVVTTGLSSGSALMALKEEGYNPKGVFCLIDRKEGGAMAFAKHQLFFESIFNIEDFRYR